MDENQFQFLVDSYVYRLGELSALIKDLGRPLLVLNDHIDSGSSLAIEEFGNSLGLTVSRLVSGDAGLARLLEVMAFLPDAGEISLLEAPENVLSQELLASLDLDGVLVFRTGSISAQPVPGDGNGRERAIRILSNLAEMLELATDPEIELEGQEEHEAESLKKRLENPHLDSARRHAPMIPGGLRAFPFSLLDHIRDQPGLETAKNPGAFTGTIGDILDSARIAGSPATGRCLAIIAAINPLLHQNGLMPDVGTRLPRKSELHAALSGAGIEIHHLPPRNPAKHHLHQIWTILDSWSRMHASGNQGQVDDQVLVLEEAWYDGISTLAKNPAAGDGLGRMKLAECAWMEDLVSRSGTRLVKIAFESD